MLDHVAVAHHEALERRASLGMGGPEKSWERPLYYGAIGTGAVLGGYLGYQAGLASAAGPANVLGLSAASVATASAVAGVLGGVVLGALAAFLIDIKLKETSSS